jgi:hypothetical protein
MIEVSVFPILFDWAVFTATLFKNLSYDRQISEKL